MGFPIRTSADQRPVDGSPQLFAVTHVLHRFLAPRHPPLALCSLEEQRCSCLLCSSQRASHGVHQPSRDRVGATTFTLDRNGSGRRGSGARELVPCAEEEPDPVRAAPSKRKRRPCQPMWRREEDGSYDTRCNVDRHVSAPTGNWFELDRTNAGQQLNGAP